MLTADNDVDLDISLAALPYEHLILDRATPLEIEGQSLTTCSAEDLLDWTYITTHLTPLAEIKEDPRILAQLNELKLRYHS
ncbi:MAG: hypothetical protein K2Q23_05960 [Bryobacteraceae bacterium]|nr:hypothetical protein [Bryobacteraceae bacterium]